MKIITCLCTFIECYFLCLLPFWRMGNLVAYDNVQSVLATQVLSIRNNYSLLWSLIDLKSQLLWKQNKQIKSHIYRVHSIDNQQYSREECYWHYWTKFHFSCLGQSAPITTQQLICHEKFIERNKVFMNTQQCYALILSNACNIEFFQAIKTGSELGLEAKNNPIHFKFNGQK